MPCTRSVRVIILDEHDNVGTLATAAAAGDTAALPDGAAIEIKQNIPPGHKVALRAIGRGEHVIKYGAPIGIATCDIEKGSHVHIHNLASARGKGRETELV